ncbi:hypothetical protein KEM56_003793, partial [Ascosphaera pollenicola]
MIPAQVRRRLAQRGVVPSVSRSLRLTAPPLSRQTWRPQQRSVSKQAASAIGLRQSGASRAFTTTSRRLDDDDSFDPAAVEREADDVDVCIVGGGPAGLAAAIKLKQRANEAGNEDLRVLLLEKGGEIGDHIVSGNVLEPSSLNDLLPDWLSEENPSRFEFATPATSDSMKFLTQK